MYVAELPWQELLRKDELRVAIQNVVEANHQARVASPFGTPRVAGS